MWDAIAYDQIGSTDHTDALIEANLKHHDIYIFPAGITLTIPDVPTLPPGGLPPWKQVSEG
jgi:phage tail protein X